MLTHPEAAQDSIGAPDSASIRQEVASIDVEQGQRGDAGQRAGTEEDVRLPGLLLAVAQLPLPRDAHVPLRLAWERTPSTPPPASSAAEAMSPESTA